VAARKALELDANLAEAHTSLGGVLWRYWKWEEAEAELIGKAVVLTDGKAGTVVAVSLDELHGLRISIAGHDGKWPVSTIKFVQN